MGVTAAVAAVTTAGAGIHQAETAAEAKRSGEQRARGQAEKQQKMIDEAKAKEAKDAALEQGKMEQSQKRARQRSMARSAQGRSGTILTSPLGEVGDMGTGQAGKTLLGA